MSQFMRLIFKNNYFENSSVDLFLLESFLFFSFKRNIKTIKIAVTSSVHNFTMSEANSTFDVKIPC